MAQSSMNLYCFAAGLFFAAAAYAQLNDPDPELWIAGYLVGGCVFNVMVATFIDTPTTKLVTQAIKVYAAANTMFLIIWIQSLIVKLNLELPPRDLAWSVLEFEEGREIGGMLLLLLHVLRLKGYLQATTDSKNNSGKVGTLAATGVLFGASWLWVNYQPAMNQRENVSHCNGQFGTDMLPKMIAEWLGSRATDQEEL